MAQHQRDIHRSWQNNIPFSVSSSSAPCVMYPLSITHVLPPADTPSWNAEALSQSHRISLPVLHCVHRSLNVRGLSITDLKERMFKRQWEKTKVEDLSTAGGAALVQICI